MGRPHHGAASSIGDALDALHRADDGLRGEDYRVLLNLAAARRAIDAAIEEHVRVVAPSTTWEEIGADLGMTRQGAQQRFGRLLL